MRDRDFIISILNEAVVKSRKIRITIEDLFSTYNDTNSQRGAYLTFYSYNSSELLIKPEEFYGGMYHIRRSHESRGESLAHDGAILGVLTIPKEIENYSIKRGSSTIITINQLTIKI